MCIFVGLQLTCMFTDSYQMKSILGIGNALTDILAVLPDDSSDDIPLPMLPAGYYKLTIKSGTHLLAGWFEVY